jgi:4-azaleucine resistance transporter AzlC
MNDLSKPLSSPGQTLFQGARDTLPLVLAAIPFGILYGALAQASGMSFFGTAAMSLLVFAGSSQFVAVNLWMTATPILVVVMVTFFINLRHMMYSANLVPVVKHLPAPIRALLAFWLTDETFAVVARRVQTPMQEGDIQWYFLGSALFMYLNWQVCSWTGYFIGQKLDNPLSWGLDIAMVVAFIGVIVPLLQTRAMWVCAAVAFVAGALTQDWPYQLGLIFSIFSAIMSGMLTNRLQNKAEGA